MFGFARGKETGHNGHYESPLIRSEAREFVQGDTPLTELALSDIAQQMEKFKIDHAGDSEALREAEKAAMMLNVLRERGFANRHELEAFNAELKRIGITSELH